MRHSFFRIGIIFALLITVGAGTAWGWSYTVYCVPKAIWGADWTEGSNIVKVLWKTENNFKEFLQQMSKTSYTYEGEYIYEYTIYELSAEGADKLEYQRYSSEDKFENYHTVFGSYWGHDGFENKIFRGEWENNNPIMRTFGRDITFYAVPESMDGSKWDEGSHTLYADIKYGDSDWKKVQMTKSAYDYNGNPIYTCTTLIPYNVIKQIKFYYNDGSDHELYDCNPGTQYGTNDVDGKILLGWNGSHNWVSYGRDVTVYTVPEYLFKDYTTKFSEDKHYPSVCVQYGVGDGEWKTINMVKTDYTYDNYPIWKATFLLDYNIFKEFQIKYFDKANSQQVGLYQYNQGGNTEYPSSDLDDKLYHGWNGESHDFFPYTYDVKLDQQGGSGGTESIKATDGADLPVATMPGRDGYIFGGYYTEIGGRGDQYYDTDGLSSTKWNSRTITTLYAKWTAREYTVTLEGMEADPEEPIMVNVTYDAVLPSLETKHTKAHYDLLGYWAANDDQGMDKTVQLIDGNGNWIPDVAGYTGNDGEGHPTWIRDGINISLFADWTEIKHTVAIAVYPAGAGNVQVSGETVTEVTAGYATHSPELTAVPSNAAWVFKEWRVSSNDVHLDLETYTTTGTTMKINATANGQTLTAFFEPRYGLIGSLNEEGDPAGGMPNKNGVTWGNERSADYEADFEVVGFTALGTGDGTGVDLQCTRTLLANKQYKFQVVDRSTIGRDRFCLAENGSAVLEEGNSVTLTYKEKVNANVLINTVGEGNYTFKITNISNDGNYYPTLIVIRPQQVNFGQKYQDVDGVLHEGTTGGSVVVAKTAGGALTTGDWVTYNTSVTHTATATSPGYTFAGWWNSDAFTDGSYSTTNPMTYLVIERDNAYAKFTEIPTTVTLANDGHGKVQIGGVDKTSTTCGVTTTRKLTAVPNAGYKFKNWTTSSSPDFEVDDDDAAEVTLTGHGAGTAGTLTANFEERYSIKGTMNGENWGTTHTLSNIGTNAGSKDTCYVTMTLPANTTYEFAIYDEQTGGWYRAGTDTVYDMTYTNHTNWEFGDTKTHNCGITTAGKGTYKFIFNITDKTVTVVYPTSYQVNYGASPSVGGNITVVDDDSQAVPNGGYVRSGGRVTFTAAANTYYTFVEWCNDETYGNPFNNDLSWTNDNVTETQNSFAKFKSTNFVIYRTGDMSSDPRAAYDDVESYAGGTISEIIEFRMKVNELDYWYTLCLPFEVNAVQVWEDSAYHKIVPYWRTNGTYYTGHYILRKPVKTTDFAIEGFEGKDRWVDPESSNVLPSKNIPYIIQWHDEYFLDKYISFFGSAGQTIPKAMDEVSYASSDETVNIYGNNSMTTVTVRDAYLLDPDYGPDGAWMREELGTDRSVLPFECFILANPATTAKYRVLRRDMADDTPTGLDTLSLTEDSVSKVMINNRIYIIRGGKIYTIQGTFVKEVE